MNVFLIILGEITSILATIVIRSSCAINATVSLAKDGYVLDQEKIKELKENNQWISRETNKVIQKLKTICFFIPGVNMVVAGLECFTCKKAVLEEAQDNNVLVKMSDQDIELFNKLKNNIQRLMFIAQVMDKKDGEEIIGFLGNKPLVVVDHNLSRLNYDKLPELDYTLNEVKLLNNLTGYSYRVGTIDNENVAVIGIPNKNSTLDRIEFPSDNFITSHKYEKMTLDEAKDKTFTVYPFIYEDIIKRDLDVAVEEIRKTRTNNIYNEEEIISNIIDTPSQEIEGPVLRKTKTNKK